jgi:ThiF family
MVSADFHIINVRELERGFASYTKNCIELIDLRNQILDEIINIKIVGGADDEIQRLRSLRSNEDYGVIAYYPWLQKAFIIAEEEEFVFLRTARNRNKINDSEQKLLSNKTIGIVGLSVGFSVLKGVILERLCKEVRIADFDILSVSNLNRLPFGIKDVGVSKVQLAYRWILEIDPFIIVRSYDMGLDSSNIQSFFNDGNGIDLVIDECDSGLVKLLLRLEARKKRIPLLMETSDRGLLDIEDYRFVNEIFHGSIKESEIELLLRSTNKEVLMRFIDLNNASKRGVDSFKEIGKTLDTWPQLGGDVMFGGATATIMSRKLLLGEQINSGRYFLDISERFS